MMLEILGPLVVLGLFSLSCANVAKYNDHASLKDIGTIVELDMDLNHFKENARGKRASRDCSYEAILQRTQACINMDLASFSSEEILFSMCDNVDCKMRCYYQATIECVGDHMLTFETAVNYIAARAICNNTAMTRRFFGECFSSIAQEQLSCFTTFSTTLVNDVIPLLQQSQYEMYKVKYCRAITAFQLCIHFPRTETCPEELAKFGEDYFTVSTQFTGCGFNRTHPWFHIFGYPDTCNITKATTTIMTIPNPSDATHVTTKQSSSSTLSSSNSNTAVTGDASTVTVTFITQTIFPFWTTSPQSPASTTRAAQTPVNSPASPTVSGYTQTTRPSHNQSQTTKGDTDKNGNSDKMDKNSVHILRNSTILIFLWISIYIMVIN